MKLNKILIIIFLLSILTTNSHINVGGLNYELLINAVSSEEDIAIENMKRLLSKGADINFQDSNGFTSLIYAVSNNKEKIVEFLLTHKADINIRTYFFKETALSMAAKNKNNIMVELLLKAGADKDSQNEAYKTALYYKHTEIASLIENWSSYQRYLIRWKRESIEKIMKERKVPRDIANEIVNCTIPPTFKRFVNNLMQRKKLFIVNLRKNINLKPKN